LVPLRPGRREPRAVKRKKNKYPRLNHPRHQFRDRPKRHERRAHAPRRNHGLKYRLPDLDRYRAVISGN
jgi:hypothetical protein